MSNPELVASLRELGALLDQHGERHWSVWATRVAAQVAEGSVGEETVRAAFGGMGSLNDLLLLPANGHHIEQREVDVVNEQVRDLCSDIYALSASTHR